MPCWARDILLDEAPCLLGASTLWANETRRGKRHGKQIRSVALAAPVRGVVVGMQRILKVKTTLGNGYLGSRIDEERSEMRYLV